MKRRTVCNTNGKVVTSLRLPPLHGPKASPLPVADPPPIVRVERGERLHQRHRPRPVHGARLLKPVGDVLHHDEREGLALDGLVGGDVSAVAVVDLRNSTFDWSALISCTSRLGITLGNALTNSLPSPSAISSA